MPGYIARETDKIAQPAFRVLLYCDGSLNDPANGAGVTRLFDLFLEHYGAEAAWLAIADEARPMRPKPLDAAGIADARHWLNTPDKSFPATCRIVGPISEESANVTVPAFRVDEYRVMFLDMSVPADADRAVSFAQAATEVIRDMPVIASIMGMGFYLPVALESLKDYLPRAFVRYRAAIEFTVDSATMGIRKTGEGFDWDENEGVEPGIPDIGWRTIIGPDFTSRLPDLDALYGAPGVAYERTDDIAVITAGPSPVFGDVDKGEDIAPYRTVAKALKPVRYPVEVAVGTLFGNQAYTPEGRDRVEAYLARLEDGETP